MFFPQAGASVGDRPVEEGVRLPHLRTWFRTRSAIVLHLSNGILQVMQYSLYFVYAPVLVSIRLTFSKITLR